jgi:hypothetical protein
MDDRASDRVGESQAKPASARRATLHATFTVPESAPVRDPRRAARWMAVLFVAAMAAFSVPPLWNNHLGKQNKDYTLWYWAGRTVLRGGAIYPKDYRLFPFMYPPSCAAMLAVASVPGETPFVVGLLVVNSAAWLASILLAVYLATGRVGGGHPLLYLAPTLAVVPFVSDMYLLGQPNLLLLACMLGAFACLRHRRPWCAGALIGLAAAIKAFPVLAVGYLVYRREAKATLAAVLTLELLLVVLPMPMRGVVNTYDDLATWTQGMVLKYDGGTIAQRPERSYSFKNQSLIAVANRLLRAIPADGEAKDGWAVNLAALDFRTVNALIVVASLGLCGFYLASMPRAGLRTERSDATETAMLLLLIVAFSPLSFDYAFIWLLYPLTLALQLVLETPPGSRERTARLAALATVVFVFALALPFRRTAQAYGNLLAADLLLLVVLGLQLRLQRRLAPAFVKV